ncbi:MAG TPA: hypothetical protein VL563_15365 [Gemmatimonadales bacterium]|nr:hypothetical protein [Gemmatimonadales bacterium]
MRHRIVMGIGVACALLGSGKAAAQRARYSVYADLGAMSALADLNSSGTASLKGGLYLGGGLNWQMVPEDSSLVLQGDVTWTRQELRTTRAGNGTKVDLVFIGAIFDYTWIQARRFQFTLSGGGGVVLVHAEDSAAATRARPFARLGLGARYVLRPNLHAFLQGIGMIYDLQSFPAASVLGPYTRRQSEVGIGAGLALGL